MKMGSCSVTVVPKEVQEKLEKQGAPIDALIHITMYIWVYRTHGFEKMDNTVLS